MTAVHFKYKRINCFFHYTLLVRQWNQNCEMSVYHQPRQLLRNNFKIAFECCVNILNPC